MFEWSKRFRHGRGSVGSDECPGRPLTSRNEEKVQDVLASIAKNRRISIRELAAEVEISVGEFKQILTNNLGMSPAHTSHLVQQFLTQQQITQVRQPPYSPELAPCDFFYIQQN